MFAISVAHLTLSMILYLMQWPYLCAIVVPEKPLKRLYRLRMAIAVLSRAQYLISDGIVVWRAWAIWYDNRWVRGSLLFSLFGTAGTCAASFGLAVSSGRSCSRTVTSIFLAVLNVLSNETHHQYPNIELNMLGTFGLLFTNFSATIAIAVKAWYVNFPDTAGSSGLISNLKGFTGGQSRSFSTAVAQKRRSRAYLRSSWNPERSTAYTGYEGFDLSPPCNADCQSPGVEPY